VGWRDWNVIRSLWFNLGVICGLTFEASGRWINIWASTSILRKVADYRNLSIFYPIVIGYPIPGEFAVTSLSIAKLFSF
jgi:hypothetical protein